MTRAGLEKQLALKGLEDPAEIDDTLSVTFPNDEKVVGISVYLNRKAFGEYTDAMSHTEEDELNKHLDDLFETNKREELAQYPFLSFTKPADYDSKKYCVEPMGSEHAELRSEREEFRARAAFDNADRHFELMWFCAHPEEVEKLQNKALMSPEDLGKLFGSDNPEWVVGHREYLSSTIRQVARMKKKYSSEEIAAANQFFEELHSNKWRENMSTELGNEG